MDQAELTRILERHARWLRGEDGGQRANLIGATLTRADLTSADLTRANLTCADLTSADMTGANLTGANLIRATRNGRTITHGAVRTVCGPYWAWTYPTEDGRVLEYGCEARLLDDWIANVAALCAKHEPDHAARYEREIRCLIVYCAALDADSSAEVIFSKSARKVTLRLKEASLPDLEWDFM